MMKRSGARCLPAASGDSGRRRLECLRTVPPRQEVSLPTTENWLPARLIPTAGIRGEEEQERRATSALLAVMTAVPEFARAVLAHMGAPKGNVAAFYEVPLKGTNGKATRPDGAVVIERGRTRWSCLVEVKTGTNELRSDQMAGYIDMARAHDFDGVLSISNQITAEAKELP